MSTQPYVIEVAPTEYPMTYEDGFKTTFWQDFTTAEKFGIDSVKDTYKRAFAEYKSQYRYLTDLVITLNYKIWKHCKTDEELARVYDALWREADAYACDNLKGDELEYFYRTTD